MSTVAYSQIEMTDNMFMSLSGFIYNKCGINLPPVKKVMMSTRLNKRLNTLGICSYEDYYSLLNDPVKGESEIPNMIDAICTNKTDFFREIGHFDFMENNILPNSDFSARKIRIWSAGCSTGEEPYTIAMVCANYFRSAFADRFEITASDISNKALTVARRAIYEERLLDPVPDKYRKYFMKGKNELEGQYRIVPEIRKQVNFIRDNLMERDTVKENFEIIFCRNVVIYFDKETQKKIFKKFYDNLVPGGYFFIGHSETLNTLNYDFKMVSPTIYKKPVII